MSHKKVTYMTHSTFWKKKNISQEKRKLLCMLKCNVIHEQVNDQEEPLKAWKIKKKFDDFL